MARPNNATIVDTTSSGIVFQWLLDGYRSKGARDANQEILWALVSWGDSTDFLRDVVGYTEWDGASATLQRVTPMQCPLRPGLYCESFELVDMGAYETRDTFYDEFNYCFEQDWLIYQLVFTRPRWRVFSDATLGESFDNKEQNRYCEFSRGYNPRERRKSGYQFEYQRANGSWAVVPDEAFFIPDYQIFYQINWVQVPVAAVPEQAIADGLLTVNGTEFSLSVVGGSYAFPAETLLFKGPQQSLGVYQGADGAFYEDLLYVFAFQPGGWNKWLRPDLVDGQRDYGDIVRRKSGDPPGSGSAPYAASDFNRLFQPGNA